MFSSFNIDRVNNYNYQFDRKGYYVVFGRQVDLRSNIKEQFKEWSILIQCVTVRTLHKNGVSMYFMGNQGSRDSFILLCFSNIKLFSITIITINRLTSSGITQKKSALNFSRN